MKWEGVKKVINRRIKEAGSKLEYARRIGFAPTNLSDIMNGRREPSDTFLAKVGFEKVISYRPMRCIADEGVSDGEAENV